MTPLWDKRRPTASLYLLYIRSIFSPTYSQFLLSRALIIDIKKVLNPVKEEEQTPNDGGKDTPVDEEKQEKYAWTIARG